MRRTTTDRLIIVYLGFLALLSVVWVRCAWLQVLGRESLARMARAQQWTSGPLIAERGTIYDRQGRALAISLRMPSVYANPRQVVDKAGIASTVSKVLGERNGIISDRLARDKGFVWLGRQVDPSVTQQLRPLRRRGVSVVEEPKRTYPHGALAGHVVGYTDIDERGLEGLESVFNGPLRGRDGWRGCG